MNADAFTNNWALIVAAIPAMIVVVLVIRHLAGRSASGQLRIVLRDYRNSQKELRVARQSMRDAAARVEKLDARAGQTKPRVLQEARDAAEDALSLEKIAGDRCLVTANHVRRVIHEEFPPDRQEKLRTKYLPQEGNDESLQANTA
jgi:hypothetical protein